GRIVKARKPAIQGERKIQPQIFCSRSREAEPGLALRAVSRVATLGVLISLSLVTIGVVYDCALRYGHPPPWRAPSRLRRTELAGLLVASRSRRRRRRQVGCRVAT